MTHRSTLMSKSGWRRRASGAIILACAAAAALSGPPAHADQRDPRPVMLKPADNSPPGSPGITASLTVPQRYLCSNTGTLRNIPDGLVMGYCLSGWPIDLNRSSEHGYQGWAYGNYDGCGWIYAMHIGSPISGWGHSCTASTSESSFLVAKNATPPQDGDGVWTKAGGCRAFLNTRPWAAGNGTEEVQGIPANRVVRFRYLTRNWAYVMVRVDPVDVPGYPYSWVFVQSSCVPWPPGGVVGAS